MQSVTRPEAIDDLRSRRSLRQAIDYRSTPIAIEEVPGVGRISLIERPDGTKFTVSVPHDGVEGRGAGPETNRTGWIAGACAAGDAAGAGLARLAVVATVPIERLVLTR
ncbi:MAG: hypothetical protein ACYCP0_11305 [Acidiferrobacteraceae bacterium]